MVAVGFLGSCGSRDPVLAKVAGISIRVSDFQRQVAALPLQNRTFLSTPEGRKALLNSMISKQVIEIMAQRAGLSMQQFYAQLLKTNAFTSEDEIRQYYAGHKAELDKMQEFSASRIVLASLKDAKKAQALLKKGQSFQNVAKKMSIDKITAARGGLMPPFRRGTQTPEFEHVFFSLKPGQISSIVSLSSPYVILRNNGSATSSLSVAAPLIRSRLMMTKINQWIEQTKQKLGVVIYEKPLTAMDLSHAPS